MENATTADNVAVTEAEQQAAPVANTTAPQEVVEQKPPTALEIMQANVARQPIKKQIAFLFSIAASVAIGGYILMWSYTPSYQVLFGELQGKETTEIVDVLQQLGVDYRLDPTSGSIMVQTDDVQKVKLKLAAEGLPRSTARGMDILNQEQGFGTSQFIEQARYKRALEEELSRSITEIYTVKTARVHLAIPKQSVFVRERKSPSASVVVNLYAGRQLEPGQVAAVTHMIASSVPNMMTKDVTIVDQKGNLLTKPDRDPGLMLSDTQLQYTQKLEQQYIQRIEDILAPIVGGTGVRAQVVAEVDFTVTEQTSESYNPDAAAVRSEQLQEENRVGGLQAIGVPGALTNQPPLIGQTPDTLQAGEGQTTQKTETPSSSSKQSTRNYEVDRTISHTRLAPGTVKKLSVAVLVDEKRQLGETASTPLTEAEMKRINALIMDAIGFDAARGDSLNVVNAPFINVGEDPLPELPIWKEAWFWDLVKQGLGGAVLLFLIFGVIKPAFKDLNTIPVDPEQERLRLLELEEKEKEEEEEQIKLTMATEKVESQLDNIRSLVQQDPALVAQVIKNWTAGA